MPTIMIVDDNQDLLYTIEEALKERARDLTITTATTGKECLKKLEDTEPDIIILDIMMPDMNGWELSMKLKGHEKANNTPIIYLTGIDDQNCKRLGLTFGVDYLVKPFNADQLYEAITKNLTQRRR
ncbi:MAG: response regulator [Candidatus Woesearchaeota archaeon]